SLIAVRQCGQLESFAITTSSGSGCNGRPPPARPTPEPARSPPPVRLAVGRRRHARFARILGRLAEPRLQRRRPLGQRQHQLDQLVLGKLGEIIASHPILESRRDSRVNTYLVVDRPLNRTQAHSDPPG